MSASSREDKERKRGVRGKKEKKVVVALRFTGIKVILRTAIKALRGIGRG